MAAVAERKSRTTISIPNKLMAVIGDEETCVGFLLAGVGQVDKKQKSNFMVVNENTDFGQVEECFKEFLKREDVAIILISQHIADNIRNAVDAHGLPLPAVVEIPSRNNPYDPDKDSIMKRANRIMHPEASAN